MTYEEFRKEMVSRNSSPELVGLEESRNVLGLFEKADKMSPKAQAEFMKAFRLGFEYALKGKIYVGSRKVLVYPELTREANDLGMELVFR